MELFNLRMLNGKVTNKMPEILMECHERQLMNLDTLDAPTTCHCKRLINREMVKVKEY